MTMEIGFNLISKQPSNPYVKKTYHDDLCFLDSLIGNSLEPPPLSTDDAIVFIDDEETLESKNKKRKRNSAIEKQETNGCLTYNDELQFFFNFPTVKSSGSQLSTTPAAIIIIDDDDEEEDETLDSRNKKPRLVSCLGNEVTPSRVDSCFSSTDLHPEKKKKIDDQRSLSTHHDHVIDLCGNESVIENTATASKGHVSIEELGVSVEDLKNMPWEEFDPIWELRSDPWLGGYIEAMLSPQNVLTEKHETYESQNGLNLISKQHDEHHFLPTFNTWDSPPSADAIIIIHDDEEEETQESKKKHMLGSGLGNDEVLNEVSSLVKKRSPKTEDDKDVTSRVNSCFSSTDDIHEKTKKKDYERSLSTNHNDDFIDKCAKESVSSEDDSSSNKGFGHVTLEELGVTIEELKSMPWEAFDPLGWGHGLVMAMSNPC